MYKKATVHAGVYSLILGTIAAFIWQYLKEPYGIMAVVFGSVVSTIIESKMGIPPAPPAIRQQDIVMNEMYYK